MADSDEWFVGEDGCLSIEKPVDNITYHPNLNTILVSTKEPGLHVLDVTSGSVLKTSDLSGQEIIRLRSLCNLWIFLPPCQSHCSRAFHSRKCYSILGLTYGAEGVSM